MTQTASIHSISDEQRARAESAAWVSFASPADSSAFYASWLALTAARIARARAGLLLTREPDSQTYTVAAVWPDPRRDLQYLGAVAQQTLDGRVGLVVGPDGQPLLEPEGEAHVGYPLELAQQLHGAVVFDVGPGPGGAAELQDALRQIHWASAWLIDHFRQQLLQQRDADLARQALLNGALATAMQHARLQPSALAVANELCKRLGCDRVSIGFETAGQVRPLVMSNTATFDQRSDLARWIGEAMDEVLDLGVAVAHPAPADDEIGALAHAESARQLAVAAMLSVPLRHEAQTVGVISFERNQGPAFSDADRDLAEALGVLLGPVWDRQRSHERGLLARAGDGLRAGLREIAGPNRPGLKLGAGLLALLIAFIALWQTDYRISARTAVEGSTQIAAVAPFDGFIAEGLVRAGETVRRGQALARLDERDLRLERSRWSAERNQLQRRYRVAQAEGDRAQMGVLAAQMSQAEAQLFLAEERLTRATVVAPFDGIVVSGDLSQEIGSPVETGRQLFEVAPLQGYRVMLEVDDRDIARLAVGQTGELVLSGMPEQKLDITVKRITPVATQREGRNLFAVEAAIEGEAPDGLRPGMEGIGKVMVGERSLLWIWTHGFIDWLRLTLWKWMP